MRPPAHLAVIVLLPVLAAAAEQPAPAFVATPRGVELRIGRDVVATFVTDDPMIKRPYLANVYTLSGHQVTRNHPPIRGADSLDHDTMHPGIWMGFGDLSGEDFWRNKGRVATTATVPEEQAPGRAVMQALSLYHAADGRLVMRQVTDYALMPRGRGFLLIVDARFSPPRGGGTFGDQEEMGLGVRMATPLIEKSGGRIVNSAGGVTAKKTWGQAADWCDYSGLIADQRVGIAVFADPANFRPSWWHTRDYGLMVANPFGRKAMKQGDVSRVNVNATGLRLRYGVLIHASPKDENVDIAAEYRAFCDLVK